MKSVSFQTDLLGCIEITEPRLTTPPGSAEHERSDESDQTDDETEQLSGVERPEDFHHHINQNILRDYNVFAAWLATLQRVVHRFSAETNDSSSPVTITGVIFTYHPK